MGDMNRTVLSAGRLVLAMLLGGVAQASPYDGKVFITGIVDASPTDETIPPLRDFTYKAIEFFSEIPIEPADVGRFALRVYPDSVTAGFLSSSDAALDLSGVGPNERFYAVARTESFINLYDNAASPDWKMRNGNNDAKIVLDSSQVNNFGGNEVYQLVYYPNGVGSPSGLVVLDTYGLVNYPGAPSGVPSFSYDNSWAYRINNTKGTGSAFTPSHWVIAGVDELINYTMQQTTEAVPFGTYTAVPEASALALAFVGAAFLRFLRNRK